MILYQDCSSHLDSSKNVSARVRGLFSLYICIENFKNLLVRNHWTDFNIILQNCSFGDFLLRIFFFFYFYLYIVLKQGAGLIFPIYLYRKFKKSSCQKQLDQLLYNFAEIFLCDSVPRLFKPFGLSKNMAARGWGLFSLYIFIENLKNLLVRNHWTNFITTWQKCFHGDLVPRLFK